MTDVPQDAQDLWVVACTVYGEARSEPEAGQTAVAWVIKNRQLYHNTWKNKTLTEICQAPWQFSCWNAGDPNLAAMQECSIVDPDFARIVSLVVDVLGYQVESPVGKSTHYYNPKAVSETPAWALNEFPEAIIGAHWFFAGIA